MKLFNVEFDDFHEDKENNEIWAPVCDSCRVTHSFELSPDSPMDEVICGVKGCSNEADSYVTVMVEKEAGGATPEIANALDAFQEVLNWCDKIESDDDRLPLDLREKATKAINAATITHQPERVIGGAA